MFGFQSVNFDVRLDVPRTINSGLGGLFLQGTPQHMGDRPRLGRGIIEDCSNRSLRLLSHQFLRETCHFQQTAEDKFAHMIERGFKRNHELGVE